MARDKKMATPEKVREDVVCFGMDCPIREDCQRYKLRRKDRIFSRSFCLNFEGYPYHVPAEE